LGSSSLLNVWCDSDLAGLLEGLLHRLLEGLLERLLRSLRLLWLPWLLLGLLLLLNLLATLMNLVEKHPPELGNLLLRFLLLRGAGDGAIMELPETGEALFVLDFLVFGEEGNAPHHLGPV